MRLLISSLLCVFSAVTSAAQTDFRVEGTPSQTAAIISYVPAGSHTVEVSTESDYAPVVNDVNGALFTGAATDTSRADTWEYGGRRFVIIGHRDPEPDTAGVFRYRVLEQDKTHYVRIGGSLTGIFRTSRVFIGTPDTDPPPFHLSAPSKIATPFIDWSSRAPFLDFTGLKVWPLSLPTDYNSKDDFNFCADCYADLDSAWTNDANIVSGVAGTRASTSTVDAPMFLPIDTAIGAPRGRTGGFKSDWQLASVGISIFGLGTGTDAERTINICLTRDAATCFGNTIQVILPATAGAAGMFPATFPSAGATDWGVNLARWMLPHCGSVTVASGVVTITLDCGGTAIASSDSNWSNSMASHRWLPGAKIHIAGSSPTCPNNLCTFASRQSDTQFTLVETGLTIGSNAVYNGAGLGFLISKASGSNAVEVSALYWSAIHFPPSLGIGGGTTNCHPVVATGTPSGGRLCMFMAAPIGFNGNSVLYWLGPTGEVRLIGLAYPPGTIAGYPSEDNPNNAGIVISNGDSIWHPTDGNKFYVVHGNPGNAEHNIFEVTHNGTFDPVVYNFPTVQGLGGALPGSPVLPNTTWVNITRQSLGQGMNDRAALAAPTYNATYFGSLNLFGSASSPSCRGLSGNYFWCLKGNLGGSQDNPTWFFGFNITDPTGASDIAFSTFNSPGFARVLRWSGAHSGQAWNHEPNTLLSSMNAMPGANSTSNVYSGPYSVPINCVYKAGVCNADTSIPPTRDGTYDMACDGDLSALAVSLGGTGNNCVRMRFEATPCKASPQASELTDFPCPWDAARSTLFGQTFAVDDFMQDQGQFEHEVMAIGKLSVVSGTLMEAQAVRFVPKSYCTEANLSTAQKTHSNGWSGRAMPPTEWGCTGASVYVRADGTFTQESRGNAGSHNVRVAGPTSDKTILFSASNALDGSAGYTTQYDVAFDDFPQQATNIFTRVPLFDGVRGHAGSIEQSYAAKQSLPGVAALHDSMTAYDHGLLSNNSNITYEARNANLTTNTCSLVGGTTSVYTCTLLGTTADYKRLGFMFIGGFNLRDISSTTLGNVITDATTYAGCYAYRNGECRTGSTAGTLYISVPNASPDNQCHISQIATQRLCATWPSSSFGWITESRVLNNVGYHMRGLSRGLSMPGRVYSATTVRTDPTGRYLIFGASHVNDEQSGIFVAELPRNNTVTRPSRGFADITIEAGPKTGADGLYVWFGYNDDFHCIGAKACRTDASIAPYAFDYETVTSAAIPGSVRIPAKRNRTLYYQKVWTLAGAIVETGPLERMTIP